MTIRPSTPAITALLFGILNFAATAESAQTQNTAQQTQAVAVSRDSGPWRREPFIGSSKKSTAAPTARGSQLIPGKEPSGRHGLDEDIHLQGIMQADNAFHAMINGRSVKAGDTIGSTTIREISRFRVVVVNGRKEKVVYDIYQGRIDRGKQ